MSESEKKLMVNLGIPEESVIKFLKGFQIERSEDKSTLFVSTSSKSEQEVIINMLSLLDKRIDVQDIDKYTSRYAVVIPHARQLLEKLQKYRVSVGFDSGELLDAIQECVKNGGRIEYKVPWPGQSRHTLTICDIADAKKLITGFEKAGVRVWPYHYPSDHACQIYPNQSTIDIYDGLAMNVVAQLLNRNIKFNGDSCFLPKENRRGM